MNEAERDARISRLRGTPSAQNLANRRKAEGSVSGVIDATVTLPPEPAPVKVTSPTPTAAPAMSWRDVQQPTGVNVPPLAFNRFAREWANYVNATAGESRQPSLEDWQAFRERDVKRPVDPPSKLAHLIETAEAKPTDWSGINRITDVPQSEAAPSRLGNTGPSGRGNVL